MRRAILAAAVLTLIWPAARVLSAQSSGQPGPSDLVPFSQLPQAEQLPAAPLLIGAYAFVWVALLAYVWSIWRRLDTVEKELGALSRRLASRRD
jgi:CcmD family protein